MGRRSEHSRSELQELIINATGKLIDTHGADGVTARMIAEAIEYTPGMLYSVFKNLDDIFLRVNTASLEDLHSTCKKAGHEQDNPRDAILALGNAYVDFALTRQNRFELMFKPTIRNDLCAPPAYLEKSESLFRLVPEHLRQLSPNASEQDLMVGSRALWSALHGATTSVLTGRLMSEVWQADKVVAQTLISQCLAGWEQQFSVELQTR